MYDANVQGKALFDLNSRNIKNAWKSRGIIDNL